MFAEYFVNTLGVDFFQYLTNLLLMSSKNFQMKFRLFNRGFRFFTGRRKLYKNMEFSDPPAKASFCCEETVEGAPPTYAMYEALKDSCQNNATFFQPDDSENGQRLYQGFMTLLDHIDTVWPLVDHVRKVCNHFFFFESFIKLLIH